MCKAAEINVGSTVVVITTFGIVGAIRTDLVVGSKEELLFSGNLKMTGKMFYIS